jgi:hypothetical protein
MASADPDASIAAARIAAVPVIVARHLYIAASFRFETNRAEEVLDISIDGSSASCCPSRR